MKIVQSDAQDRRGPSPLPQHVLRIHISSAPPRVSPRSPPLSLSHNHRHHHPLCPRTHPSPLLSRTPAATAGVDPSSIPISRSTPLAPPHAARTLSPRLIDFRQRRRAPPPISAARTTSPRLTELLRRYSADINFHLADIAAPLIPVTGERLFHLHCSCCHPRPHCIYVLDLYLSLTTIQEGRPRSDLSWVPSVPTIEHCITSMLPLLFFEGTIV
uniref:Uncharacterized protein n=1 Tax=Oryza glumipatula TaxID=40148 RepID=A0A0D9Z9I1_9ORYZ